MVMASFKRTYKKLSSHNIAGPTGLVIDNIFQQGHHYFIVGYNIEYVNTGGHLIFYYRESNSDITGAYTRDSAIMQHSQGNIIFQSSHGTSSAGTIGYAGDQPEESLGFKLFLQPRGLQGWTNHYVDSIGHVSGTGFRGQKEGCNLNSNDAINGISIIQNGAGNFQSGIIDIYEITTGEHL
jgi:hypothetical protein